ncbi:uncharacterized protein GLRG_09563 [Colletotrichum graminicola M1.001]|uniref:Mitochondrial division protein 1 n=1 Tax=Colletotrichum graminicola (strain M1.001 / M2 / FGSC 10212) TaxID=645133 RepID=E3QU81_COLGM|nr:uncharacterized protein GLRG_09563 [Colletotrichum graminicola M1.001]EFQ34419.1 hypothetical protein GLRG_09563 [Colletotrichum graminicola M1.001]
MVQPESALIAASSNSDTVYIWRTDTGECTQVLENKTETTQFVTFSHDSSLVLASTDDGKDAQIWRTDTGKSIQKLERCTVSWARSAVFSHDSAFVVSASSNELRVWKINTGGCARVVPTKGWDMQLLSSEPGNLPFGPGKLPSELSSTCIVTNIGAIAFAKSATTFSTIGIGVSRDRCWITWNGQNLLWLPVEFRSEKTAVRGSTVVIGCDSRLIVFRFNEAALRLIYG